MILHKGWAARPRRYVGLMSGTSLDGIDAALVEIDGVSPKFSWQLLSFISRPYSMDERSRLAALMSADAALADITRADSWLGEIFAEAALSVVRQAGMPLAEVDAISSHGQTVLHIPPHAGHPGVTRQIGDAYVIAERTGIMTVADFRPRDMAAGGHGAPLVPYADKLLFAKPGVIRAVQNIGGIANVTYLPASEDQPILAFDTGPGNMVIDALVSHYGLGSYDKNGTIAAHGKVNPQLLHELMAHDYFLLPPPKSTGREMFGADYCHYLLGRAKYFGIPMNDLIATATNFTASSIVDAYQRWLPTMPQDVILGGGGCHNATLLRHLQELLPESIITTHEQYNIPDDAKEAIAFTFLAHAALCGVPANIPAATGASHPVILGKIIPGKVE